MTIVCPEGEDSGIYTCFAYNDSGHASCQAELIVEEGETMLNHRFKWSMYCNFGLKHVPKWHCCKEDKEYIVSKWWTCYIPRFVFSAGPMESQEREVELGKRRKLFSVYDVHEEIGRWTCTSCWCNPTCPLALCRCDMIDIISVFKGNLRGSEACSPQTNMWSVCCQVSASAEQHSDQGLPGEGLAVPPGSPQSGLSAGLLLHQTHAGADHRNVSFVLDATLSSLFIPHRGFS